MTLKQWVNTKPCRTKFTDESHLGGPAPFTETELSGGVGSPRPAQPQLGPGLHGAHPRVWEQTSAGSRLRVAAQGPKSWGGHTRGELWPGGPGQARVSRRRDLAPRSSMLWWACTTPLAPGCRLLKKSTPPPRSPRAGWRGVGARLLIPADTNGPEAGPLPNHRPRCEGGPQLNIGPGQDRSRPGPPGPRAG